LRPSARHIAVGLCALGLGDSLYLTFFEGSAVASCAPGTFLNCAGVLTSPYSKFLGIPVSLPAAIWFLVMGWNNSLRAPSYSLAVLLSALGLAAIAYFISLELFVLRAICTYCTLGHISGLAAILLSLRRPAKGQRGS
jgi:uncharacterized membrane protein